MARRALTAAILAVAVSLAVPGSATSSFPGANGRIAWTTFSSPTTIGREIAAMDADGSHRVPLTSDGAGNEQPAISPDGERIAFTSHRDGDTEIYVIDADGGNPVNLTNNAAFSDHSPQFSPDGQRIVFARGTGGIYTLYLMNADGSDQTPLPSGSDAGDPTFSPDGETIAYTKTAGGGYTDIYAIDADGMGSSPTNLTNTPGVGEYAPDFSPDGRRIALTSNRDGSEDIFVMDPDGSDQTALTSGPAYDGSPAFSPGGDKIAFARATGSLAYDIYVMGADGTNPVNLTNSGAQQDTEPSWGPLETNPPETSIDSGPDGPTNDATPSFEFSSDEADSTFECRTETETFAPCESPHVTGQLADGIHTFEVRAIDRAGNVDPAPAARDFSVDATPPPAPSLGGTDPPSPASDETPRVLGSAELGTAIQVFTDGTCSGAFTAGAAAELLSPGIPVTVAKDATTVLTATATDAVGNTSVCSPAITYTEISSPPTASISTSINPALTGDTVTFDASGSGPAIARYEWDLDGDGSFETDTGTAAAASRAFEVATEISPGVRVTDALGRSTEARTQLSVRLRPPPGALGVSINGGAEYTNDPQVTLTAVWPLFAHRLTVSNDGGFAGASEFDLATGIPWTLRSSGPERLPKTVYARFLGGESGPETYQDDIILDETAPKLLSVTAMDLVARAFLAKSPKRTYRLRVRARDRTSRVVAMQVTAKKRRPGKLRAFRARSTFSSASPRIFVRVRDGAGNVSRWQRATR